MEQLLQLLSHFDILLFVTAVIFFTVATIGKIGIPKFLPVMSLATWQRLLFGVLSFLLLSFALIPLLPTRISFTQKLLDSHEGEVVAPPQQGMEAYAKELPEVPAGKKALLLVTAQGFSSHSQKAPGTTVLPTLEIGLQLDDRNIGASRSSWTYYTGTVHMNPTITTSVLLTPGRHKLKILLNHVYQVQVEGTQLRYQMIELD